MDKIKRYHIPIVDGMMIGDGDDPNGEWVRYEDHAAALSEAHATIARLEEELGAFLGVWAVEYAKRMGFAEGELHPQHYDRMAELGLRMVDFRRAALSPREGEG